MAGGEVGAGAPPRHPVRGRLPRVALLCLLPLAGQEPAPRYAAAVLADAAFLESVATTIRTQVGAATRVESVGREGRWQFRTAPEGAGVRLESWYDSLRVWREADGARVEPDTDGLVGGRYRGVLSPDGRYTPAARPFLPAEVAAVTDLADAMLRFLPPLPPAALAESAQWDGDGLRIVRRPDSLAVGERLWRFRWVRQQVDTTREWASDSASYQVRTTLRETGDLAWHARLGPVAWLRRVTLEVEIPADGAVRRASRSRIEERTVVRRLAPA